MGFFPSHFRFLKGSAHRLAERDLVCFCRLLLCKLIRCFLQPQSFAQGRGADRGLVGNSKCDGCRRQPPLLISPAAAESGGGAARQGFTSGQVARGLLARAHLATVATVPPAVHMCMYTPVHMCMPPAGLKRTHALACVCSCYNFFFSRNNDKLSIAHC